MSGDFLYYYDACRVLNQNAWIHDELYEYILISYLLVYGISDLVEEVISHGLSLVSPQQEVCHVLFLT